MKRIIYSALVVLSTTIFNYLKAQVTTVVYQPAGNIGIDAVTTSTATSTNYGALTTFQASRNAANERTRSQILFNLSTIPSHAIVTNAKLTLYGTAHSGTANACYLKRNNTTWAETSITWANMPATVDEGQINIPQSSSATQVYQLDVKLVTQNMINIPAANFGWTLIKQNETTNGALVFASSDNQNPGLRPKLEISYCFPITVQPYMVPSTGLNVANGMLFTTASGGVPPYSYLWSDGSTGKDLLNKVPGVYSLTITDGAGNTLKKDYILAAQDISILFTLVPDGLSGTDAMIQLTDEGASVNANLSANSQLRAERGTAGAWFKTRSLLSFDLSSLPANTIVNSASLTLYGDGHNPLTQPNNAKLYLNSGLWREPTLTWSTQPAHSTTNPVVIAPTTSANENRTLNVSSHTQAWIQNPSTNFGWKMILDDEVTQAYSSLVFGSSDHATIGIRPKLDIMVKVPSPSQYPVLKRKLDGNFYQTSFGVLAFKFDEEYVNNGVGLEYKIYDYNRNVIVSNLTTGASLTAAYKDNRFQLALSSLAPTMSGYYVLEVKDKKGDIFMLRFKI